MLSSILDEKSIIGGILKYGWDAFVEVDDLLKIDTFSSETNQLIYKCTKHILNEDKATQVDWPTLSSTIHTLGFDKQLNNEKSYIQDLFKLNINLGSLRKIAQKIRKLQVANDFTCILHETSKQLQKTTGDEKLDQIVSGVEKTIFDFVNSLGETEECLVDLHKGIDEYLDYLGQNQRDIVGISSGFPIFDKAIGGGFRRKSVSLIGAEQKCGKTSYGVNIALFVARELKIPVLYLDSEMSKTDILIKSIANLSNVIIDQIETGKFFNIKQEKDKVDIAKTEFKLYPIKYQNIANLSFEETLSLIRRWIYRYVGLNKDGQTNDCLVVYDYFKIMGSGAISKELKEYQALGFQLTDMVNFAIKYDVPVISFAQLNREGDIAASSRLMWFSSSYSMMRRKTNEEIAESTIKNGNRILEPKYCRYGEEYSGGNYINYMLDGSIAKFKELGTRDSAIQSKNNIMDSEDEVPEF